MENIKTKLSDVANHWTAIGLAVAFLFTGNTNSLSNANALITETTLQKDANLTAKVEPVKMSAQLKKETLERFSNTVYKPSDALSGVELKKLLQSVGFEGKALKTAWAIAMRESNGRPMAYNGNRNTGDSSYGIFQINMLGNLGIDRKEKFQLRSNVLLFDPVINAEITYYMTGGGKDWSSWKGLNASAREWLPKFPNN